LTTPSYKIAIAESTAGLIRGLHPELKKKTKSAIRELTGDPFSGKELRDELKGLRSFRVGRFRIIYRISGTVLEIAAIGPRKIIYQETLRLVRKTRD
jgi:mRNA interferase RelE/StbE